MQHVSFVIRINMYRASVNAVYRVHSSERHIKRPNFIRFTSSDQLNLQGYKGMKIGESLNLSSKQPFSDALRNPQQYLFAQMCNSSPQSCPNSVQMYRDEVDRVHRDPCKCYLLHNKHFMQKDIHWRNREEARRLFPRTLTRR